MANGGGDADLIPGMGDLPVRPRGGRVSPVPRAAAGTGNARRRAEAAGPGSPGGGPVAGKPAKPRKGARSPAESSAVARVAVDIPLPHLDRLFDYLVPADLHDKAVPGCRVRVRFAGQLVDGFLLERVEESEHEGRLAFLERVTSPEPVLSPEIAALVREVADRYAGTFADVLRLAIPPRHARVEAEPSPHHRDHAMGVDPNPGSHARSRDGSSPSPGRRAAPHRMITGNDGWGDYPAGASFLDALADGRAPRAVWTALPGPGWPAAIARAVLATMASGRGALIVAANGGEVARLDAALTAAFAAEPAPGPAPEAGSEPAVRPDTGPETEEAAPTAPANADPPGTGPTGPAPSPAGATHVVLTAQLGPAERYRRWLAVRRGLVKVVVGTRAAMFAPVADLGLVVLWDDGDDVHAEPHAPYPHAREVLALRAHRAGAGALIGGFTRTTDATQLVETGWAQAMPPDRARLRAAMPRVLPAGDDVELARDEAARIARLPDLALRTARQALRHGPVLVQVPRRGYLPALACARCRGLARCTACQGPLSLVSSHAAPHCAWCGRIAGAWSCPDCQWRQVRAIVVGARRTAEELGRAFPGVTVRTSGRDAVLDRVGAERELVVATPGAEPVAETGYAAALLLDGRVLLGRAELRAGEEALRRWMNAGALVRPAGPVVVLAEGALAPVQALLRWDAVTFAERELEERRELGFPPAARMASLTGTPAALRELLEIARLPDGAEILGPVPIPVPARSPVRSPTRSKVTGAAQAEPRPEQERALVRVPRAAAMALAHALKAAQGVRSARKAVETVRIQIDPMEPI